MLRLDAQGRVSSYKIEPWFDTKDRALYPPAYSALYEDPRIFITRLSYDFNLDGTARKMQRVLRPELPEVLNRVRGGLRSRTLAEGCGLRFLDSH